MTTNIYSAAALVDKNELLLTLSCPAFINSSLLGVNETFTDKEPEKSKYLEKEKLMKLPSARYIHHAL